MPLSHPIDDAWLIELLNGLLDDDQRGELLAHIRGCPECEARMRALARERELVRAAPVPVINGANVVLRSRRAVGRPIALTMVAAAVVAAVVVITMSMRDRHEQYWIPVASEERTVLRAAQPDDSLNLEHALRAYERRDAGASVRELERNFVMMDSLTAEKRLLGDPSSAGTATATAIQGVFLASAQLNAGDPEAALKTLDVIGVESLPPPWSERGRWVQYLALERLGRSDAARDVLVKLRNASGEIGQKAQKRLDEN